MVWGHTARSARVRTYTQDLGLHPPAAPQKPWSHPATSHSHTLHILSSIKYSRLHSQNMSRTHPLLTTSTASTLVQATIFKHGFCTCLQDSLLPPLPRNVCIRTAARATLIKYMSDYIIPLFKTPAVASPYSEKKPNLSGSLERPRGSHT